MQTYVEAAWQAPMQFDAQIQGHKITMDLPLADGGQNAGPTPKPLLLVALAGCTGLDVVSLLNKMRQPFTNLQIDVAAEMTDVHPKYYHKIHLVYRVKGEGVELEKVEKAVSLSQEKYCGVSYMLRQAAEITYEIRLNEVE